MPPYPVQLNIDYPEVGLDRVSTAFRLFAIIPIAIVFGALSGSSWHYGTASTLTIGGVGLLFIPVLLMILFRQKYPRWWFDWNLQVARFGNRVAAYFLLLQDRYPATDDDQGVHLEYPYPNAQADLNRWLPLVKWFLAIPHYVLLFFLSIGVVFAVLMAWVAILFTGRYPHGLFDYVSGVMRWENRVAAYAFVLVTDEYPPFRLKP